ncbi:uncharacterized protein LOC143054275 isoform X2 [Mytilus galloprovincialis]
MEEKSTSNFCNATKFCENKDSFIKWDPTFSCTKSHENFHQKKHWTSIKRSHQMSRLTAYDENITLMPLKCRGIKTSEDLNKFAESSFVSCKEFMIFYCRYRAIAGTTLLAIVVGLMIFVFRRRSAKTTSNLKHDEHRPINTKDIRNVNNQNRYSYSEVKVEGSNQHDNMNDEGDDQYTTGPSDVYDHLNEKKNKKMKTENSHAIYDHSIGDNAESDYDITKHVVPTNPEYQEVRIGSEQGSQREKL